MKKLLLLGMLLVCFLLLPFFTTKVKADDVVEVTPLIISSPNQVDNYLMENKGLIAYRQNERPLPTRSFKIEERSWVIFDFTALGSGDVAPNELIVSRSPILASQLTEAFYTRSSSNNVRLYFYLEPGTYYCKEWYYQNYNMSTAIYLYVIPNSAVISDNLVKDKDGSTYTDKITTVPHFADSIIVNSVVAVDKVNDEATWKEALSGKDNVFTISENGEYTVKVTFRDSEWKDFPVMYSFAVYDIGKSDKSSDDDGKKTDVKLNKTTATIKVGETFKLKVTGAKVVSYKSSKKSVAKVSSSGKVVGKKKGTATIKVKCDNGETYTCKIKVEK